jgi:mannose/fructose/N-acetylgalactosamine-specific phosphotransferase system component IID
MDGSKKGQGYSLEVIIGALVTGAIFLIVGVYVVTVVGNQFTTGASANVNNTVSNVTSMFSQIAPLLVVIGIIAFIAIVLMFVRGGIAGGSRGGM